MKRVTSVLVEFHPDQEWGLTVVGSEGERHYFSDMCPGDVVCSSLLRDGYVFGQGIVVLVERGLKESDRLNQGITDYCCSQ